MKKQWETNPEIQAQLNGLIELSDRYERGQVIAYSRIERAVGVARLNPNGERNNRFAWLLNKWSRHMARTRQIHMESIPGEGIKLLTHEEQAITMPQKRLKRAYRQHGRIIKAVNDTDFSRLSMNQRLIAAATRDHSEESQRTIRNQRNVMKGNLGTNVRASLIDAD